MEKIILNKLPVPTFGWLKVNSAERDSAAFGSGEEREILLDSNARAEITGGRAKLMINAEENSRSTAVIYISGSEGKTVSVQVNAAEGAEVKLVEVYENSGAAIGDVKAEIAENAAFELVQLHLGGEDTLTDIRADLAGRSSRFKADIGYLLGGSDKLDINLVASHAGKKSDSEIAVKGVMGGKSEKIFRGTIDFLNGSSGAKGTENEEVLLMDETVRNRTVPLILCAEEDVEGAHGASIGRIDDEQVFYMQSRGIPTDKIYELMAKARIGQIVAKIGDEDTVRRVNAVIHGGEGDE